MSIPDDTLATLRALNDLDLGALARNAGIYSHMELTPERLQVVAVKVQTTKDIGGLIAWLGGGMPGAQHLTTLGAKVRAALPAEQTADLEVCEDLAKQKAEVARLRGLLDSRTLADAMTLTKPLRIALGLAWSSDATPPEQVIAGAVAALDNAAGAAALGKPDEPITVARALLKQAASTMDLVDRLALVIEARQWVALDH